MPAIDPYLGALAAFGRAARGGAASVMAHYTRFQGRCPGRGGARSRPRGARCRRARDAGRLHARPQSARLRRPATRARQRCRPPRARPSKRIVPRPDAEPRGADRARRGDRRRGREPDLHRAVRPQRRAMVLGRAARRDRRAIARAPAGASTCISWRRAISAPSPTAPILKAWSTRLGDARPADAAPDARPLRPRAARDLDPIARAGAVDRHQPELEPASASGIAPIGEAIQRGCRVALGVDASALDEDDDIVREMRLGHFLHGGWGFEASSSAETGSPTIVANGRFANGAPGTARSQSARPPTFWSSTSTGSTATRSCRSSRSISCSRAPRAAHIERLIVAGREIVRDGRLDRRRSRRDRGGVARRAIASGCRPARPSSTPGRALEPAAIAHYRGGFGCC